MANMGGCDQAAASRRSSLPSISTVTSHPPAEWAGNKSGNDVNVRSHLALIERVALAAFPKDPEARSHFLDAARERMANNRRSGARFDRAEVTETKVALEPKQRRSAERTKAQSHVAGPPRTM